MTTQWTHNLGCRTGESRRASRRGSCRPSVALSGHLPPQRNSKDRVTGFAFATAPSGPPG